jgi:hypothetical protein
VQSVRSHAVASAVLFDRRLLLLDSAHVCCCDIPPNNSFRCPGTVMVGVQKCKASSHKLSKNCVKL